MRKNREDIDNSLIELSKLAQIKKGRLFGSGITKKDMKYLETANAMYEQVTGLV